MDINDVKINWEDVVADLNAQISQFSQANALSSARVKSLLRKVEELEKENMELKAKDSAKD